MAQGFTKNDTAITYKDSANLDAFSRLRVSNPLTIFSNQFTYDLTPLIFEEVTNNAGTTSLTHDATNRLAQIAFTAAGAATYIYMQSYEYIPYQPGRSQLVFITFNMFPSGGIVNTATRVAGLGDSQNGFEFRYNGATSQAEFLIRSSTGVGNQIVAQSSWNLDKLNGNGKSGYTLDLTKPQILVIDFQALYVGRVRMGFDIGGEIIYAHEFLNSNTTLTLPYIATANLPIRVGMVVETGGSSATMDFICCSVSSEGGLDDSQRFGYNFTTDRTYTTLPAALTYVMSIRPTSTFNGITNRTKFILDSIDLVNAGNKTIYWQIGIGGSITTPTYTSVNATYSAIEKDTAGTLPSALAVVIDSGYVASGGGSKTVGISELIQSKYPITLDAAGSHRDLGTLRVFANGEGGTSDLYMTLKWKEIR